MSGSRTGRRRGETQTKAAILDVARRHFAEMGYRAATLRGIARDAGVDPALIHHFFGQKINLFRAALDLSCPDHDPDCLDQRDHGEPGPHARQVLGRWQDPELRQRLQLMLRAAVVDPQAAELIREAIEQDVLAPAAQESPEAELEVALVSAHALGMTLLRHVVELPALTAQDVDRLAEAIESALPARPALRLEGDRADRPEREQRSRMSERERSRMSERRVASGE
jgi:AcrR family transcriptional regulator